MADDEALSQTHEMYALVPPPRTHLAPTDFAWLVASRC